jgi:hypothetical protein
MPLPPPTSTTVSSPRQSSAASRSTALSLLPAIARSKAARSCGCSASHGQKPVPKVPVKVSAAVVGCRSPIARWNTPPKRWANSRQPCGRSSSDAAELPNTPGAVSSKTPSLASARRMRCSVSGCAPSSVASSVTGRGPSASASATPRSATMPSARDVVAPRRMSHSRSCALTRVRRPLRPRRPRRPTA